jgi:aminopeptidase N
MRLLIDRRLLAQTKRAESVSLFPLLEAFAYETEPLIWELLSAIINDLKIFFVPKSKEKRQFKKFVRKIALPNYERLGVKAKNGEPVDDMKLRPIIMALMHFAGDEEYIEAIEEEYSNIYVAKLNPDLRWIVASTLVREHSDLSLKYFGIYCATPDAALKGDLMGALTGVRDREIALSYFAKLEDKTIRPQDRLRFYLRLLRNHEIRKEAFDWAYKNWEWLYREEGDKTIADYPRYMAYYAQTEEDAAKFKEFFKRHAKEKILARDIAVAFSEIDARLKLIASDRAAIYKYLGV